MNELKPCPFCGSESVRMLYGNFPEVECHGCHAHIDFTEYDEGGWTVEKTREEVIALWNRRVKDER